MSLTSSQCIPVYYARIVGTARQLWFNFHLNICCPGRNQAEQVDVEVQVQTTGIDDQISNESRVATPQITHDEEQPRTAVTDNGNQQDNQDQDQDNVIINKAVTVALSLMGISATLVGGIMIIVIEHKQVYSRHKILFNACLSFSLVTFSSGVSVLLVFFCRPCSSGGVMIVKLTMLINIGSIFSAFFSACVIISSELFHPQSTQVV